MAFATGFPKVEAAENMPPGRSHFICTIKPYFKWSRDLRANASLQLKGKKPNLDAKRVSSRREEAIVPASTSANANSQFPEEKKPNLDAKRVRARRKEANVPASTFANANHQFISTITPYAIRKPCFYLPSAFANSNGLVNRRCEMILRDEKQRLWSVQLDQWDITLQITRMATVLGEANGVQIGDTYKFELIDNGTIPIAYFH
ncbi:hypothetical protein HAX54_005994 [Datura stramonium]|uniref:TF-B3 domain-containing protein n=1 Tax=Datura stramonium TaxID=4076 RepID=A0ABS8RHT3_DATST|nr:hypothetical protein [Datura stramonium]